MTTLDTSDLNSPSRPTPDQIKNDGLDTFDIAQQNHKHLNTNSNVICPICKVPFCVVMTQPDQIKATQPDKLDKSLRETIWYELGDGLNATDVDEAIVSIKNLYKAYFLEIIEGCKPAYWGGSRDWQERDYKKQGVSDYHTNLIKQVKGEK